MRFVSLAAALLLAACANKSDFKLPGVYRIDIQQGNIIEQAMLAKLKPGMDKSQVQFIMGTPSLVDPFHTNQWEYIYTFSKRGGRRKQRHITLYFEDDKLAYLDGDVVPGLERPEDETLNKPSNTVDVSLRQGNKRGFFGRMFGALPLIGGDDEVATVKPAATDATDAADPPPADDAAADAKVDDGLEGPPKLPE